MTSPVSFPGADDAGGPGRLPRPVSQVALPVPALRPGHRDRFPLSLLAGTGLAGRPGRESPRRHRGGSPIMFPGVTPSGRPVMTGLASPLPMNLILP
jgi:hypothetical protein